jgi:cyclophilin family peptidyl-prolyl cis-trans isomerase
VGTDKRERQKANRQQKLEEMAREARRRKTKRRALQIGLGIPALILIVFGLVHLLAKDEPQTVTPAATTVPGGCPATDGSATKTTSFSAAPPTCIDATKTYTVQVDTSLGSYTAELFPARAPLAVNSFVFLARNHYFDGTPCHRIIPGFVIQCGDPTGSGSGGPGYSFNDELPASGEYQLGSLAMANSGPNTNGSQFFVISGPQGIALPPSYTLFGQVTSGLDVVAALDAVGSAGGTPTTTVTIDKVTVTESAGTGAESTGTTATGESTASTAATGATATDSSSPETSSPVTSTTEPPTATTVTGS